MSDEVGFNFRLHLSKKILLRVVLPIVIVGLLLIGLAQQGILSDWFNSFRKASATVKVIDNESAVVTEAQVIFGDVFGVTDSSGNASITGLVAKKQTFSIRKTGFVEYSQEVKLKKGANDLGTVTIQKEPTPRTDLTLDVTDYISGDAINDTQVSLADLKPIYQTTNYKFVDVPIGVYNLLVSKTGYNSFSKQVTIEQKTTVLDKVELVKAGAVVFESNRDGGKRGVFTANYDGSSQKNLVTRVGTFEDYTPVLGPNQKKVFFTSTRDGVKNDSGGYKTYLYIVDVDGKNLNKVSENADTYSAVWSPDGGYIGFVSSEDNYTKIRLSTYNVTTHALNKFTDYNVTSYSFAFSQDGGSIAFSGSVEGASTSSGLFIGNSNGQNIKKVDDTVSYTLEFTSAGKLHYSYYDDTAKKTRYFEYDPATNNKTEITATPIDNVGAVLSPDKKLRAYVSTRDGKTNLYVSDPDGKNEKKLTDLNRLLAGDVLWAKDSSFIMFNYRSDEESSRYLVSTNGKTKARKIVDVNLSNYGYGY